MTRTMVMYMDFVKPTN